MKLNSRLQKVG